MRFPSNSPLHTAAVGLGTTLAAGGAVLAVAGVLALGADTAPAPAKATASATRASSPAPAVTPAPAQATAPAVQPRVPADWRDIAVRYADTHWNWSTWQTDSPKVGNGTFQPDFQCAEFDARALADAGLVPGLTAGDPQDAYAHYRAPNGKQYDLLLISTVSGERNLYDYLMDLGIGSDLGNQPSRAQPGDLVVTFNTTGTNQLHTGLIAQAATADAEPFVDAHNVAHYRRSYQAFDAAGPAHVIRIDPQAINDL
ncbi:hypothetical protein ACIRS1_05395 [Kitasatospora sp. NPDC101176]|uniref:hypothetical protein n=1 Tax=Kitasatospora sp. NPDC101176 TaxID=3364099 RepID=UPI003830F048